MSGQFGMVPARAYDDIRMSDALLAVLGLLSTHTNRNGWVVNQKDLAARRGVSQQAISKALLKLEEFGYLTCERRMSETLGNLTNVYRICYDGDLDPTLDKTSEVNPPPTTPEVVGPTTPEVVAKGTDQKAQTNLKRENHSLAEEEFWPPADEKKVPRAVPKNFPDARAIWGALISAGLASPGSHGERNSWNAAIKKLRAVDPPATPEAIASRVSEYRRRWPEVSLSPHALEKHWGTLGRREGGKVDKTHRNSANNYQDRTRGVVVHNKSGKE